MAGSSKKKLKILGKAITVVCLIVFAWYLVGRIVSSLSPTRSYSVSPPPLEFEEESELRVGGYNIAHGRGGGFRSTNWDGGNTDEKLERLDEIASLIIDADLDIVILNEVDFSSVWSGHLNQAEYIARQANYHYVVEQTNIDVSVPFVRVSYGNAILSKYPVTDVSFLNYPNTSTAMELLIGGFKEGVIAQVELPGGDVIQVAAVHLSVDSESVRIASIEMLLDHYKQSGMPLLLIGDFNTAPTGYPQHHADDAGRNAIEVLLESDRFNAALPGLPIPNDAFTFPSEDPGRVIDFIFVTTPWVIDEYMVIQTNLSDHLPVTAVISRE